KEIGIALDYDYTNYHRCEIYGIAIYSNSIAYYIKKDNLINDDYLLDILCSNEIAKDCYDYKAIKCALYSIGIQIEGLYNDILLGCYLLDSSLTNDIDTAFSLLGTILSKYEENNLLMQGNIKRTCEIAANSFMLINQLTSELEQNNYLSLYKDIEIPLCSVLADMENEGFPLDVDTLNEIGKTFQAKLNNATEQIYKVIGKEFNISSPKQVAEILFDELQLPDNAKRSTSIEVLNNLKDEHPVIPFLITYRKYQKLMSTYITGIQAYIHKDGKLHPTFNQALTTTGRLSSSEPNLQNISVRDEEAKLIRKSFFYKEDNISILSLDYSQIELRLLASMSKCDNLINIFNNDEDIHAATARNVFHVTEPTIPNDLRRKAKAVNFGIVYGISTWGLAEQIHCSPKEAADIIDSFYQTYPEIAVYLNDCKNKVQDNGYVTTLFGRKRFIREIFDSNYSTREFAKRAAMNAPIQGTAADLIKIAMIKVANHIKDLHLKSRLVLQIHDELILKVYDDEKDIIMKIVKEDMENAYKLQVKLTVDGGFGKTWYDAK
ncbi:MAG: DNA polymerase I, partial [Bacilli bacterium]|nr:DNA polymerase I [Bacilli bacterium]